MSLKKQLEDVGVKTLANLKDINFYTIVLSLKKMVIRMVKLETNHIKIEVKNAHFSIIAINK